MIEDLFSSRTIAAVAALGLLAAAAPPGPAPVPPPLVVPVTPRLATVADDRPATITLSPDGRALLVTGPLGTGSARRFAQVLAGAPQVGTIVLESEGGMLGEASRMAELVQRRGLDTYVEQVCASACTIVLLAGRDRAVSPNAIVGFHQPYDLRTHRTSPAAIHYFRLLYRQAGVAAPFIERVFTTPPQDLWRPSYQELLDAHVVTRRTLGGETNAEFARYATREELGRSLMATPFWRNLNEHYPVIAERVIGAMWEAKTAGRTDGEAQNAGRHVLINNMGGFLAGASDALLDQFLTLMLDEMEAAHALSDEACLRLFRGQLDVTAALPPALTVRELALLDAMIAAPSAEHPLDRGAAQAELLAIVTSLPEAQARAMLHPQEPASDQTRCLTGVNLFRSLAARPLPARIMVTRFLFAAAAERQASQPEPTPAAR